MRYYEVNSDIHYISYPLYNAPSYLHRVLLQALIDKEGHVVFELFINKGGLGKKQDIYYAN